jgi:carbon-monoxide dehydrogenase medium subunit
VLPAAVTYEAPTSIEQAVAALAGNPGAVIIGASPRTVIDLKLRRIAPSVVVDLRRIEGLRGITHHASGTRIGSLTTLRMLEDDTGLRAHAPLGSAAQLSGDPQLRNMETVLGCLTRDLPTSAVAAALLVLDAVVDLVGPQGRRTIALSMLVAEGTSSGEIPVAVRLRSPTGRGAYARQAHPATLDPVCGIAAWLTTEADGSVGECRLAVVGATAVPSRLVAAEAALVGRPLAAAAIHAATEASSDGLELVSDATASGTYRRSLVTTYLARLLGDLVEADPPS